MNFQSSFLSTRFENRDQLISFLQKENNSYSNFILEKLNCPIQTDQIFQKHHIQPKHANGPDIEWNEISLTLAEHADAHKRLFDCYGNYYDKSAWLMMTGQTEEGLKAMKKQIQLKMKLEKRGFFDPNLQRELSKRPKSRKPYARNKYICATLEKGFILESINTKEEICFLPQECSSMVFVIDKWVKHPTMIAYQKKWKECSRKEKFYLYTALTRLFTGHRDLKSGKCLFSVANWRLLGIFL